VVLREKRGDDGNEKIKIKNSVMIYSPTCHSKPDFLHQNTRRDFEKYSAHSFSIY